MRVSQAGDIFLLASQEASFTTGYFYGVNGGKSEW